MRIARSVLCVALGASLVSGGVAQAATKPKPKPKPIPPVCNLVVDDAGDASFFVVDPSNDSLDIVGGDVASNDKTLTGVLRIKDLSKTSPVTTGGRNYYVQFKVPGVANPIYLAYDIPDPSGSASYEWGDFEPAAGGAGMNIVKKGDATGKVDAAKNEIHISVPVADFASVGKVTPGTTITDIHLEADVVFGIDVESFDTADGSKPYTAGAPSCVTPGA